MKKVMKHYRFPFGLEIFLSLMQTMNLKNILIEYEFKHKIEYNLLSFFL